MDSEIKVIDADLANPAHANALVEMLDGYMRDPMEGGQPPSEKIKRDLVPGLRKHPACYVMLAFDGVRPVGFAICFTGFSTFNARPLLNIHDIYVDASTRGKGIGKLLLERIETLARSLDCCRLSLEVREDNRVARGLYRKFGFDVAVVGPERVKMEFWQKPLKEL
jgi:ribosomal protein S18 acetylase RimI-like enzyme